MTEAPRAPGGWLRAYDLATAALAPLARAHLRRRLARGREDPERWQERLGRTHLQRPEGRLVWLHAVGVGEVRVGAEGFLDDFPGAAGTGSGVTDVKAFTLGIGQLLDTRAVARDNGNRLRVHGEHRAQILEWPLVFELRSAVVGMVLPIRLGNAEL